MTRQAKTGVVVASEQPLLVEPARQALCRMRAFTHCQLLLGNPAVGISRYGQASLCSAASIGIVA